MFNKDFHNNSGEDNVIYTDYQDTKNEIKDYAKGWLHHFSNYLMYPNPENVMGMKKYAMRFITKTKMGYSKFRNDKGKDKSRENKFEPEEIQVVLDVYDKLLKKAKITDEEYICLNDFIYKYMNISGIDDIIREKDDPATAVRRFN